MSATPTDGAEAAEFSGRNAVVTGSASGIGKAAAAALHQRGANVLGLDISSSVASSELGLDVTERWKPEQCDVTDEAQVQNCLGRFVDASGPLDFLVSNAGVFTAGSTIDKLDLATWERGLRINLTSHLIVLQAFLAHVNDNPPGSIVFIGTRNVAAPGPGAAAYSVPKAGLTQLARIAALELGARRIRVNVVHPDAVFDTALWTPEVLERSAARYGLSVEEYKRQNVLGQSVGVEDVANMICLLLGQRMARTTGAQIPVDGGHTRVI